MELVINKSNFRKAPIVNYSDDEFIPGGILNSEYKSVVKSSLKETNKNSVFSIRNRVKQQLNFSSTSIETILKIGVFAILLGFLL